MVRTLGGVEHDERAWYALVHRWVWGLAAIGAGLLDIAFAWQQLWLQPRLDAHGLPWWQHAPLTLLSALVVPLALGIPAAIASGPGTVPQAFLVQPGRFVVPVVPKVRVVAASVALGAWGIVPVLVAISRRNAPDLSTWVAIVAGALMAVAVTAFAMRIWRRKVLLTPSALVVREVLHDEVVVPWDLAELSEHVGRLDWCGVDAAFLARVIEHYRDHPEHREAIGTAKEYARVIALPRRREPAVERAG